MIIVVLVLVLVLDRIIIWKYRLYMTNGKMCTYHFVYRNSNEIDRIYHIWYMYLQLIEPM